MTRQTAALPQGFTETFGSPNSLRILDSTYCRIAVRDHPDTIVSFAPINCPPGKFNTSRILDGVPQNVVFLNCPRNGWFLEGIPGLGGTIEDAAEGLQTLLDRLDIGHTRMLYWGGSMGGFGAVAFGTLANADLVVATGAELALLVEGGNSELILKKLQGRTAFPEIPIESWIRRSRTQIHLYCGEFAYYDLVSALRIVDFPDVRVGTLRDFGHALPGYVEETYGLYPFLCAQVSTHKLFDFKQGESGLLNQHRDWWRDLHAVSMNLPTGSESRLLDGLRGKANLPPEVAGHCGHALSKGATLRGDHRAALEYATEALRVSGPGRYLSFRHVQAQHAAGTPPEVWLRHARQVENLNRPNRLDFGDQLVEMIVSGYRDSGDKKTAAKFISNQQRLSKDQAKRIQLLNRLAGNSEGENVWKVEFTAQCTAVFSRHVVDRAQVTAQNQQVMVSGTLLAESPEDQIAEVTMRSNDGTVTQFFMTHESPGLAKLRPDLPHAGRVRFKVELLLDARNRDSVVLSGNTFGGKTVEWLVLTKMPATGD